MSNKQNTRKIVVADDHHGRRLDLFVVENNQQYSRSIWSDLIKDGYVSVNGKSAKPSYKLEAGDTVEIKPYENAQEQDLNIVYEDRDVIVINKPRGLLTHLKNNLASEPSVAGFIKDKIKISGDDRSGIVHRLDRETSGVIITAKNQKAAEYLSSAFADREVGKWYLAVCTGGVDEEVVINSPIARSKRSPGEFVAGETGKPAMTTFYKIRSFNDKSIVLAKPETGRTHQIRVHLKSLGHPIVGDRLYLSKKQKNKNKSDLLLHAWRLQLTLPNGKDGDFVADIPEDMTKYINDEDVDRARTIIASQHA